MSHKSKFLPVLALAAALSPFAANARSGQLNVQSTASQQYLVSDASGSPIAASARGRAGQSNPPAGFTLGGDSSQYAAVSTQPEEN